MRILVIDGQGGGLGKTLVEKLRAALPSAEIIAVGTNSAATAAMLKGGAALGATGENPVIFNSRRADVIVGPMGMVIPHAMVGEISPAMAEAVGGSGAKLVLIPVSKCCLHVVGVKDQPLPDSVDEAVALIRRFAAEGSAS